VARKRDTGDLHALAGASARPEMLRLLCETADVSDVARPSRRERRPINFLAPQLQADDQIDLILTLAHETGRVAAGPLILPRGPRTAIVLTNERLFEIRIQSLTARPKKTLAAHPRDSVTAEWTRDWRLVGGGDEVYDVYPGGGQYRRGWIGKLTITSPSGTKTFWVGDRHRDRAQAIAACLNTGRT
jgi:hypothetical protein